MLCVHRSEGPKVPTQKKEGRVGSLVSVSNKREEKCYCENNSLSKTIVEKIIKAKFEWK